MMKTPDSSSSNDTGDTSHKLINRDTGEVLLERLLIADTFWKRFLGLQFRRELSRRTGLLIAPCSSIHTFGMRFDIDVAFIDSRGTVTEVHQSVAPCRLCIPKTKSYLVLETTPGTLALEPGTPLAINGSSLVAASVRCLVAD